MSKIFVAVAIALFSVCIAPAPAATTQDTAAPEVQVDAPSRVRSRSAWG